MASQSQRDTALVHDNVPTNTIWIVETLELLKKMSIDGIHCTGLLAICLLDKSLMALDAVKIFCSRNTILIHWFIQKLKNGVIN